MRKNNELGHDLLKELLYYDQKTGIFTWKQRKGNVKKGTQAGTVNAEGYIVIQVNKKQYKAHRLAFFYMTERWPTGQIDHINHNKSDNRWKNLRDVTNRENQHNRIDNNKYIGVSFKKQAKKWRACIKINSKTIHLGYFENPKEGAEVYQLALKNWEEKGIHPND